MCAAANLMRSSRGAQPAPAVSSAGGAPGRTRTTVPGADPGQRPGVGRDDRQRAQDSLRLRAADAGPHLAAAHGQPDAEPAVRELDAECRPPRETARSNAAGSAAASRIVVEDHRRLARLLVLVLAHQRHPAARARAPVDVARIVAVAEGAQPAELALPAGRDRSPGRRVRRQAAQQRLGRGDQRGIDVELVRVGDRARRAARARTETSSPAGIPTGGSARAAPSCCGRPSPAARPAGSLRK